ncbi:MAG TPA: AMED_5909 family protein [Actinophytocola sp.]|uniref:AMED_5909 family protein n=1 Tax=Actinophytocola sp. TaxID=1872138 RepID=UPI002DBB4EB7|nr:AMED_5909 family protein [Actinophytocola sp.]HEU5470269.1 AMED_5909 family protein [Actinophytocola sp.]
MQRTGLTSTPNTLAEAHEALMKIRPARQASLTAWRNYRLLAARVYAEMADVDRFHHHEALYWAQLEREEADTIARKMSAG